MCTLYTLYVDDISFNMNSLLLSEESTLTKPPVRGHGRKSSLTKPTTTSTLFDEGGDKAAAADMTFGLSGSEESGLKAGNFSEAKPSQNEEKLERPLFPWQKGRQSRSQSLGSIVPASSHLPAKGSKAAPGSHMTTSHDPAIDHTSQMASFQEMLLQQQKQMQEQFAMTLQSQLGGGATKEGVANWSSVLNCGEEERFKVEVKKLQESVKELEEQVQMEKKGHSDAEVG